MGSTPLPDSQRACELLLAEGKRYNLEHHILPSENAIADRLLSRGVELKDAYEELHGKLAAHPHALKVFLDLVLSTAAFWNPDRIREARTHREALVDVNRQIERRASELADLLQRRSELQEASGFTGGTYYHVCDVIEAASSDNPLFEWYLKKPLTGLHYQYDLKYWPSLSKLAREIALDARAAVPTATDPLTAAATNAARPSLADFFKALFAHIEENSAENYGQLPRGFKVSDSTLASLANCALDLGPDELVDSAYVKRLRQRERNNPKNRDD